MRLGSEYLPKYAVLADDVLRANETLLESA